MPGTRLLWTVLPAHLAGAGDWGGRDQGWYRSCPPQVGDPTRMADPTKKMA